MKNFILFLHWSSSSGMYFTSTVHFSLGTPVLGSHVRRVATLLDMYLEGLTQSESAYAAWYSNNFLVSQPQQI